MAIERKIRIENDKGEPIEVNFKASANVPRMYRIWFRQDIIKDMAELKKAAQRVSESGEEFSTFELTMFENIAYTMARLGGDVQNFPSIDEWFDGFSIFSIYEILPELLDLWNMNMETTSDAKKKQRKLTAK
ncbi:MAG: hypothetical protein IJT84_03540 [Clostridia bacterium]|nr:hypothetical protein [Clostridia bacterium]